MKEKWTQKRTGRPWPVREVCPLGTVPAGTSCMLEDVGGKRGGGVPEKNKEELLTQRLFLQPWSGMAFPLNNFTKDHRLPTPGDIRQFCSPNSGLPCLIKPSYALKHTPLFSAELQI